MQTVPPSTAADIEADLLDPTRAVYLYIGKEGDVGWANAKTTLSVTPRLQIYLVKDTTQVAKWIGNKQPAGVVFGWSDQVFRLLKQSEADDLITVVKAISDAMNP